MKILEGIPASPGLAGGSIIYFEKNKEFAKKCDFDSAILSASATLDMLKEKALNELTKSEAEVFEAYKMLLCDDMLILPVKELIESGVDEKDAVINVTENI